MRSIFSTFAIFAALSTSTVYGKPWESAVTSTKLAPTATAFTTIVGTSTSQAPNATYGATTTQAAACVTTTVLGFLNNGTTTIFGGNATYTAYPTTIVVNGTSVAFPTPEPTIGANRTSTAYPTSWSVANATTILSTVYASSAAAVTTIFPDATTVVSSYFPGGTSSVITLAPSSTAIPFPNSTYPNCTVTVTVLSPSGTAAVNATNNGTALNAEGGNKNGAEMIFEGNLVGTVLTLLGAMTGGLLIL